MTNSFKIIDYLKSYNREKLQKDAIAGLTVGILLVPQAMAYATIAGLPPIYGLYASIIPLLVYPLFGSCKQLAVGIIAIDMVVISTGVSKFASAGSSRYIMLVATLAVTVGIIQIIMSFLKLGFIVNYISSPVIVGFTNSAAIIIAIGQLGNLVGLNYPNSLGFYEKLGFFIRNISNIEFSSFIFGITCILAMIITRIINKKIPISLLIVILSIFVSYIFNLHKYGIEILGSLPRGLPKFKLPAFSFSTIRELVSTATTLALIQLMSISALGKMFRSKYHYSINFNKELFSIGCANLCTGFFQGIPASASFSRSAINDQTDARTPLSNWFSALLIIITLLLLTKLFYYLPITVLAAIIIFNIVKLIRINDFIELYKTKKSESIVAISTAVTCLVIGIREGIILGVLISLIIVIYRKSRPNVVVLGHLPGTKKFYNIDRDVDTKEFEEILILRMDASFSFLNADFFKDEILRRSHSRKEDIRAVIIDASGINNMDVTALEALQSLITMLEKIEVKLYLVGLKGKAKCTFRNSRLFQEIGNEYCFSTLHDAVVNILKTDESVSFEKFYDEQPKK